MNDCYDYVNTTLDLNKNAVLYIYVMSSVEANQTGEIL